MRVRKPKALGFTQHRPRDGVEVEARELALQAHKLLHLIQEPRVNVGNLANRFHAFAGLKSEEEVPEAIRVRD